MNRLKIFLFGAFFLTMGGLLAQVHHHSAKPVLDSAQKKASYLPEGKLITLTSPDKVILEGSLGKTLQRGIHRLTLPPYTLDWLLADVSFKIERIFTNYSGDVSGRFLELGVLTSPPGQLMPAGTLPEVIKSIKSYQKPDGHFGVDVDFSKPFVKVSPEITTLWGNARLLVGLVTAAEKLNNTELLDAACKLGDFYVNTSAQLCSPAREEEYRATGTYGDGYTCCYFPAMEGLVMLYKVTREERYLQQALRMAEMFLRFDVLPVEHSHGNLCAWRSILDLYELTGNRTYLDRAVAKWDSAVEGGYVWALGGLGEHWYVNFEISEGCSESDWLRFNLGLWKNTGQTKYLDMADRLIENQYIAEQSPNGGFGMRQFDGVPSGPVATFGSVGEWEFCCSFHGPLGLYFLKSHLATTSNQNIYVNFPYSFDVQVRAGNQDWNISVKTDSIFNEDMEKNMEIELTPALKKTTVPVTLLLRVPSWAKEVRIGNSSRAAKVENGYVALSQNCQKQMKFNVTLKTGLSIEGRSFHALSVDPNKISRFSEVSMAMGAKILFETPSRGPHCSTLLATVKENGQLDLLRDPDGSFVSVDMKRIDVTEPQIIQALDSCKKVFLKSWPVSADHRSAFTYNLVVIPERIISKADRKRFASRVPMQQALIPHYGTNLEKNPDIWPGKSSWNFLPDGILITGGYTGLIEGKDYQDYQFDFDLTLPLDGQGVAGWVVRVQDENNCILFRIQSADSPFEGAGFKNYPNSLRPETCKNGHWQIAKPVTLPMQIKTGGKYQVRTVCKGSVIEVFIDGTKVYEQSAEGIQAGAVGFTVGGKHDQGFFQNIGLIKQ